MNGSTLDKAHRQAQEADQAIMSGKIKQGIVLYKDAASIFESVKQSTRDPEALKILDILNQKYTKISEQLQYHLETDPSSLQTRSAIQGQHQANSAAGPNSYHSSSSSPYQSSSSLTSTLASARGIPVGAVGSDIEGHYVSVKRRESSMDDPFTKCLASLEAGLNKLQLSASKVKGTYEGLKTQVATSGPGSLTIGNGFDIGESFYLVTHDSNQHITASTHLGPPSDGKETSLVVEMSNHIAAQEHLIKKQRDIIRTSLGKLRQVENKRMGDLEAEIDRLATENEKLKIQNGRLRSRWEELKDNNRKKRSHSSSDTTETIVEEEEN
ncbi:hypothetical protein V1511DRAFT_505335 [Dipodascopsis uninucleata]